MRDPVYMDKSARQHITTGTLYPSTPINPNQTQTIKVYFSYVEFRFIHSFNSQPE